MLKAKSDYCTHFISTNSENPRQMWNSINTILHWQKLKTLPEHSSLDTLCSSDKIAHIRSNFVINYNDYDFPQPQLSENTLQCFTPATTNEVFIIIKKPPNKSCDLDSFPTLLLKSCINQLIFPITTIINLSMQGGVALFTQQPPYLASLLHLSNIPRQLRSSISQQLIVPKT